MKKILFITNLPSFYKINLFNELSKSNKVLVYYTYRSKIYRNANFFVSTNQNFIIIPKNSFLNLIKTIFNVDEIFFGGWDDFLFYLITFITKRKRNILILESSILEYKNNGIINMFKNIIKYFYLKRFIRVIASGQPHKKLLIQLNYNGQITISRSVGILDFNYSQIKRNYITEFDFNFLFIGRDSYEKGLDILLNLFIKNENWKLNIIGDFSNHEKLNKYPNIVFHGYVNRTDIQNIFNHNSVLIVPSRIEPWGLVVEESLYHGLPVIVSNNVGCANDLVIDMGTGMVFELNNINSLEDKILQMSIPNTYNKFINNINKSNYDLIKNTYINSF